MFRFVLLLILYLLPSSAFATKRLAVLEFQGVGVDKQRLLIVTDYVRNGVLKGVGDEKVDGHDILIMTRENMMDMLSSMGKTAADCQGECVVEIARNIGVDYVVSGSLYQLDGLYFANITFHETTRGQVLVAEEFRGKGFEEILDLSKSKSFDVVQEGLGIKVEEQNLEKNKPKKSQSKGVTAAQESSKIVEKKAIQILGETINVMGYEMVRIPAGNFIMGCISEEESDCSGSEKPSHEVIITRDYYMGRTEVTQGLYEKVMGNNPSYNKKCGDNCPVDSVSWYDAVIFANRLSDSEGLQKCYGGRGSEIEFNPNCTGYALPTEAEWEYAARGREGFKFSGSNKVDEVAWYYGNSSNKTHPIGQKMANGYGLHDMSGNVYEWVWDWKGTYNTRVQSDPTGVTVPSNRVLRGGDCYNNERYVRVSYRNYLDPSYNNRGSGFRLRRLAEQ